MITDAHGFDFPSVVSALQSVMKTDEIVLASRTNALKDDHEHDAKRLRAHLKAILASYHGAVASLDRVEAELPFAAVPVGIMRNELCGLV